MINSIDNLPVSSSKKINLLVEAQLYHANTELVPRMGTPPIPLPHSGGELTVQHPIMLPIKIRDLPKVSVSSHGTRPRSSQVLSLWLQRFTMTLGSKVLCANDSLAGVLFDTVLMLLIFW